MSLSRIVSIKCNYVLHYAYLVFILILISNSNLLVISGSISLLVN